MAERKKREGKKVRGVTRTFRMNENLLEQCNKYVDFENEVGFHGFYSMTDFIHQAMIEYLFDRAIEAYATDVLYGSMEYYTKTNEEGEVVRAKPTPEMLQGIKDLAVEAYKFKFADMLISSNLMDDEKYIDEMLEFYADKKMKEITEDLEEK